MKFLIILCFIIWITSPIWMILLPAYLVYRSEKRTAAKYKVGLEAINNKNRWP